MWFGKNSMFNQGRSYFGMLPAGVYGYGASVLARVYYRGASGPIIATAYALLVTCFISLLGLSGRDLLFFLIKKVGKKIKTLQTR
jgi:hypothetical protein